MVDSPVADHLSGSNLRHVRTCGKQVFVPSIRIAAPRNNSCARACACAGLFSGRRPLVPRTIRPHVRSLVGSAKQSPCDLRPPCFAVACFDLEFDWRPFDRLRMLYDGFASMRPAPSRGFVTTFYVTYGAQSKAALYRWEFLRRNPQYRVDYNEFMRRFGAWLKGKGRRWPPSKFELREHWTKSQQRYFRTKIEPVLTQLCLKWQISDLFSPISGWKKTVKLTKATGKAKGHNSLQTGF